MEKLKLALPDASVVLKKISAGIAGVIGKKPELAFRVQLWRSMNGLDTATTWMKVELWMKMLEGELSNIQLQDETIKNTGTGAEPKTKALCQRPTKGEGGKGENGKSEGEKGKGWKEPCEFFENDAGCRFGRQCHGWHRRALPTECIVRGATDHKSAECTRA